MKTFTLPSMVGLLLAACLQATPAQAQATRTWVSGVGDDANPCSRTAPCKTFAGTISKTATSGEINCLDSGGFGSVVITKSITIKCDGVVGGIIAASTFGVIVSDGGLGTAIVVSRALDIERAGSCTNRIQFFSCAVLHVHDVQILDMRGTGGNGILVQPRGSGSARVVLNRVTLENNTQGLLADGTSTGGSIVVQVENSLFASSAGNGIWAKRAGIVVDRTSSKNNAGYGILADGGGALIHIGNSSVAGNGGGLGAQGGGQILSYQNNQASGNGFEGGPTGVLALK